MIELNGGMDSISLKKNSIQDIVNSPLYQRFLPLSFQKGSSMRSHQCTACCGDEYNHLDQGELGTTSRGLVKQQEHEEREKLNAK
jgi:hypothetical protein